MEKPAPVTVPIHELLQRRWSPRAFADRPVEPEKLTSLFEAARWAPSCFNEQPWRFLLCTREHPADFRRLLGCLAEANAVWARQAPVLLLSVAKRDFSHNGKRNRHAVHDVGLAAENLVLQAVALGLCAHQMAGFDAAKARETFAIPEEFEPVAAIAVGYPGDPALLPAELQERERAPRARRPRSEILFEGQWGSPSAAGSD
jgi:nitroreductase